MDTYLLGFFIMLVIGGIGMWIRKRYLKKVMERGLGRKVEDRELTSITEWMEAIPDETSKNQPPRPHV
jgi:hypothetical protein